MKSKQRNYVLSALSPFCHFKRFYRFHKSLFPLLLASCLFVIFLLKRAEEGEKRFNKLYLQPRWRRTAETGRARVINLLQFIKRETTSKGELTSLVSQWDRHTKANFSSNKLCAFVFPDLRREVYLHFGSRWAICWRDQEENSFSMGGCLRWLKARDMTILPQAKTSLGSLAFLSAINISMVDIAIHRLRTHAFSATSNQSHNEFCFRESDSLFRTWFERSFPVAPLRPAKTSLSLDDSVSPEIAFVLCRRENHSCAIREEIFCVLLLLLLAQLEWKKRRERRKIQ